MTADAGGAVSNAVTLEPVAQSFSLKDHVYAKLREAILEVRIYDEATDLRLDERTLAEQLGISRTPVREAVARIAQEYARKSVTERRCMVLVSVVKAGQIYTESFTLDGTGKWNKTVE